MSDGPPTSQLKLALGKAAKPVAIQPLVANACAIVGPHHSAGRMVTSTPFYFAPGANEVPRGTPLSSLVAVNLYICANCGCVYAEEQ